MGFIKKFKDLLEANLNDLLNKAEDPEKMLNLYIEKATEELKDFNVQVNRAVADELLLKQKMEAAEKEITSWMTQAKVAIQQNRDDLAKIALDRKQTAEKTLEDLKIQLTEQQTAVAELRENYRLLDEKLSKARAEKDALIMRQRRAQAMKQAGEAVKEVASSSALGDFDRMKDKVARMEAEARATSLSLNNTVEDEFENLKKEAQKQSVEDELARMKAELSKKD
ncbi:phage shock protein A [Desulfocucumis palustris]|uniref:Phage shock protein A n=1 Tax=Desulfocucumis palustris TaxID=1898651 RepID=A0A2L2XLE0_9FIRM|nr:PspA/IM30 family protein [Desulfocucumis palustris]GBF34771.1 phage shock protein A [Desulfocucumis palustris]